MITKKFTFEVIAKDGAITMESNNDGFTALEVIGILETKARDIYEQMRMPAKFKRIKIKEDGAYAIVKEGEEE